MDQAYGDVTSQPRLGQMIESFLNQDLYKHTMQQAVLELYPDAYASYKKEVAEHICELHNATLKGQHVRVKKHKTNTRRKKKPNAD
jgi:hypothetical protein